MKSCYLATVLAVILVVAGAARSSAQSQNQSPSLPTASDARRLFALNMVVQTYQDEGGRNQSVAESLKASAFDTNRDGKLDDKEFAAWEKRVRAFVEQRPNLMKKFDANHDGILDDAEWNAAYARLFETKPAPAKDKK